jgi:ABC-type uncharacterized transport system involved in gliding motility auxiliary subunit
MSETKSSTQRVNPWIGVAVLLGVIIALSVVAKSLRVKVDLTAEKQFTLSPGAEQFLAGLEVPVTLKFYYSRGNQMPAPLKQYTQRTVDLLREMERASGGKLALELFDPQPDSDEEELAQRYGLIGQPVNPLGGDAIYIGLVGVSGQRESAIPFLPPNAENQLEYNITRLIHEVSRTTKPKIGIMSNLPVVGTPRPPSMRGPGQDASWLVVRELRRHFEVTSVQAESTRIPDDITTLMVIHPKSIGEATLYAIDQFVMRGGRLLVFQDPMAMVERNTADSTGMAMFMGFSSDLSDLTSAWGVTMPAEEVVGDISAATQITFGNGQAERLPTWLSLGPDFINQDDVLLSNIRALMFPFAGAFDVSEVEGITATPLVSVSSNAVAVNAMMASAPGPQKMRDASPLGARPLAVRLHGTFPSAFPGGPPASATNDVISADEHRSVSEGDSIVMMVADVDGIYDQYAFRTMNLFGQTLVEYANDNFSLMMSLVEQSAGSEALIGLRSRGVIDRSFTRVRELEEAAQQRWQAEELKLMDRLQETQQRLNELQVARDDQQQIVLTPEQAAEIEEFRKIRFETQRELKNVRRNLRQDIERLGFQVKALNMAAIPLLVAVFGVARGWRRRRG